MWLVQNNNGRVVIEDDGGNEVLSCTVPRALLGLGLTLHRLDTARDSLQKEIERCELIDDPKDWLLDHITELKRLEAMCGLGAATSYVHNAEPK